MRWLKKAEPVASTPAQPPPPSYPHANRACDKLHFYKEVTDYDSRLQELVDYFGYEKGSKAPYCRIQGGHLMPIRQQLGLTEIEFKMMHNYALFNRMSPDRWDFYYLFDAMVERANSLGGPDKVSVVDFGCGIGQISIAFASAGFQVYCVDVVQEYLDFLMFCAKRRGLDNCIPLLTHENGDRTSLRFDKPVAVAVEWSALEHVADPVAACRFLYDALLPRGYFVTTTVGKQWTADEVEVYRKDVGDEHYGVLRSPEFAGVPGWFSSRQHFDKTIAAVFAK